MKAPIEKKRAMFASKGDLRGSIPSHLLNLAASFAIAARCIFSGDAILGCILCSAYTMLYWHFGQEVAVNMNWTIVSLAVVFPISQGIGMGFKRREQALSQFGDLFGNMRAVWGACHTWTVCNEGQWCRVIELQNPDLTDSHERLSELFEEFLAALISYLDVPRGGRAHHAFECGQAEKTQFDLVSQQQRLGVDRCIGRMRRLVQSLKELGLTGGEAHRLDQYLSKVGIAFEKLTYLKEYRTPQAFRAFARIYILLIGALYGPYYVYLGNFSLALTFALVIQLVLQGLFHVMLGLEDPFSCRELGGALDCVRVPELVEVARRQLVQIQQESSNDWGQAASIR